jgi:hypothetical protein
MTRVSKVLFLLQINHFRHPRERVVGLVEQGSTPICWQRRLAMGAGIP